MNTRLYLSCELIKGPKNRALSRVFIYEKAPGRA